MNYYLHGKKGRFITTNEIIKSTDYVRDMYERPMMSADGGWDTTYSPKGWSGTAWHLAKDELTAWVGRTYDEYMDFCSEHRQRECIHEIFREETE